MRQYSFAAGGAPGTCARVDFLPTDKEEITGGANVWRSSSCIAEIKTANFSKMPANNSDPYRHGGPYDRGSADNFYKREAAPHYFRGSSYQSERIEEENMTPQQIKNYHLGYGNADIKVVAEANTRYVDGSKD